ncbi:MAG: aminofutalosine synthase MqnE [Armatimonadetes bacterium]|nr:aminofutalosine synthase MqnE [Armatimonadota bacterium]
MNASQFEAAGLADIYEKVAAEERLSFEDGVRLFRSRHIGLVGKLAHLVRQRKNGNRAYYVRNQHINFTNVCSKRCRFCSFYAKKDGPEAYTLTMEEVEHRIRQFAHLPITEIHMVAGVHPKLPYTYYTDLLDTVKRTRPDAIIKAFTMIELEQIQKVSEMPLEETIQDLKAHGLGALPGGGVEVLSKRIHQELFGRKMDGEGWLNIARVAHGQGLKSNASLLYGHLETDEERVDHFIQLRELQDETGGFLCFIPLAFHAERTELEGIPPTTGNLDLRMIAVSRLMLDNFPHIKSFWIMIGPVMAQLALRYGADDIDGTIMEYEITREKIEQTHQELSRDQLADLIREAGCEAVERDSFYNPVRELALV